MTTENLRNLVCPFKLKNIPEKILERFRIRDNDLDNTIQKALEYLCSKELDEIKFGSFLFRRYFQEKITQEEQKEKNNQNEEKFYIDNFIEKGTVGIIGKVLFTENNIVILTELTFSLINITYFSTKNNGYNYINEFMSDTYMQVFYKLIQMNDNEILINLYNILVNCICENVDFAKKIFKDENFMRLCIQKYLAPKKPINVEQDVKKAGLIFFASLTKIADTFNEKQKNSFYKIFEKLITLIQDSEVLYNTIVGLKFLLFLILLKMIIIVFLIKYLFHLIK